MGAPIDPPGENNSVGDEDSDAMPIPYCYVFQYNGYMYRAAFADDMDAIDESYLPVALGKYLGKVVATDENGEKGTYKIYASLSEPSRELIIEVNGKYYCAIKHNY